MWVVGVYLLGANFTQNTVFCSFTAELSGSGVEQGKPLVPRV